LILWYLHFQDLTRNDWEWTRKYHSWPLMTDIIRSRLPFMKVIEWDFLAQSCSTHLGYCPVPSCPVHFLSNGNLAHAFPLVSIPWLFHGTTNEVTKQVTSLSTNH
jgi:hypothetical protein